MLHGLYFGEEAGAGNLVIFRVKWLQPANERYLVCAAGAAGVVSCANCSSYALFQRVVVPVCVVLCGS